MTTDLWAARGRRFADVAARLLAPDWARRISRVSARLTKPDCAKCGGEDFAHSYTCPRALRSLATGSTAIAFGNEVKKYADRRALMAQLRTALAPDMARMAAERLSGLIAPWDSDAECARIAATHGLRCDEATLTAARHIQDEHHVSQRELREDE